jgi:hypothetical protein
MRRTNRHPKMSWLCTLFGILLAWGCQDRIEEGMYEYRQYKEGPHVFIEEEDYQLVYFEKSEGHWDIGRSTASRSGTVEFAVENPIVEPFKVRINPYPALIAGSYPAASKMVFVSDIEGNFTALYTILLAEGVIDKNCNWAYGTGHLVMLGDLFDRGADVLPLLWLLYKLEQEAVAADGRVHILLGNHEVMIFDGDVRYVNPKYLQQSLETGLTYSSLFTVSTVLGQWMRSKPAIVKVGDLLLCHAGLSKPVLDLDLDINEMNRVIRLAIEGDSITIDDSRTELIFGRNGIFWYREWVDAPPVESLLDEVLDHFGARRMIIGHTITPHVESIYGGKLITIDLLQPSHAQGESRAMRYEDGRFFEVTDAGRQTVIPVDD